MHRPFRNVRRIRRSGEGLGCAATARVQASMPIHGMPTQEAVDTRAAVTRIAAL